ncbi:HlyC/CorC family transporter [Frankia sp. CNm7]|uniref:HlyC/CorC family transporter n=1 Tax=Frankia nepalensis TaxID=1836974 RepID=A0A937UPX6_9ACTN|nr:hemolysin family protein [Frankia nepalensis]MBL7497461.1 HlyC/CorC family transporter [Frankia nepalensis]MBL7509598.1 HlyC/CorC family transporter [Frankia nepalensis]MBL7520101.1 HlyC/CorC family transporter [Frankia nepalensis]MBL7629597.1 HlyC/CorC family transporter [Frankia nepalensis]
MSDLVKLGLTVLLLLANALFVGSEFALISARRTAIEPLAAEGSWAARITLRAMEHVSLMLAGSQLGITVCTLGLGALAEPTIAHLIEGPFEAVGLPSAALHPVAFVIALGLVTFLHVVIGEMVPKNIALAMPDRAVLVLTPLLAGFVWLLRPVIFTLNWVANACLRLVRIEPKDEVASVFTRDEVAGLVDESRREGLLEADEHGLVSGALAFDERTARDVLLPREGLVTVPTDITPREIEQLAASTGYTRFPVHDFAGRLIGYLHLKDILETRPERRASPVAAKWLRPLTHVVEDATLRQALATMQRSGAHLGQVVDEQGESLGLVALEDILEELVGEIRDEAARRPPRLVAAPATPRPS